MNDICFKNTLHVKLVGQYAAADAIGGLEAEVALQVTGVASTKPI